MTDTRFSTVFDSTADLLSGVDIDEVGDIETLLMFLFARPMQRWLRCGMTRRPQGS